MSGLDHVVVLDVVLKTVRPHHFHILIEFLPGFVVVSQHLVLNRLDVHGLLYDGVVVKGSVPLLVHWDQKGGYHFVILQLSYDVVLFCQLLRVTLYHPFLF